MEHNADLLRIITFNIRYGSADDGPNDWNHRKNIFFECIRQMKPDIMGVQECLSFQSDEMKERFALLDRFGLGRYHNTRTNRNHELFSGEHCAVFYDSSRFSLERTGTFWLSDSPDIPGSSSWGNTLPRIATWGVLCHKEKGRRLSVFNTHFDSGKNHEFCMKSTRLIETRIDEISKGMPVLLMGDFNLAPDSEVYNVLTGTLIDVWTAMKKPEENAGTSHSFTGTPGERIDWILVSPELKVLSVDKITYNKELRFPSDHFPLLAVMKI